MVTEIVHKDGMRAHTYAKKAGRPPSRAHAQDSRDVDETQAMVAETEMMNNAPTKVVVAAFDPVTFWRIVMIGKVEARMSSNGPIVAKSTMTII